MTVSDIVRAHEKAKQSRVFIDGEYAFTLYNSEIRRLGLKKDKEISKNEYDTIMDSVLIKRARLRALYLLQKQDYTEYKLKRKLYNSGYPESVIEDALKYVREYGYVDDEKYARSFVNAHAETLNKTKLILKMKSRGISDEIISNVYEEYCENYGVPGEREMILSFLDKKHFDITSCDRKEKDKMIKSLLYRGFKMNDIIACFNLT